MSKQSSTHRSLEFLHEQAGERQARAGGPRQHREKLDGAE